MDHSTNLNNYNDKLNASPVMSATPKVSNLQNADKPTQTTGTLYMNAAQNKGDFLPNQKVINVDETQGKDAGSFRSVPLPAGKTPSESGSVPSKTGKAPSEAVSTDGSLRSKKSSSGNKTPSQETPDVLDGTTDNISFAPTTSTSLPEPPEMDLEPAPSTSGLSNTHARPESAGSRSRRSLPRAEDLVNLNRDLYLSDDNAEITDPDTSGYIGQLDDGFSAASGVEYVNPRPLTETTDTIATTDSDLQATPDIMDDKSSTSVPISTDTYPEQGQPRFDNPYYHPEGGSYPYYDNELPSELPRGTKSEPYPVLSGTRIPENVSVELLANPYHQSPSRVPVSAGHVTSVDVVMEPPPRDVTGTRNYGVAYPTDNRIGASPEPTMTEKNNVVMVHF